ncbi:FAD/NAD(P)-binding domain-containing protein [Mycena albidolilacea]|uniref:FAD/NAD(P)-binding domain-containing protein n=1 Tax=Mycena albidolilacea TaxID=1033008 RepID=A0AAD6Z8Q2_9AGAR|nr:FAD/NAD(P)-binding domain-containing protein [Mycena albidolilacea]
MSWPVQYLNPINIIQAIWRVCYVLVQHIIIAIFKAPPPKNPDEPRNPYGRIAVIGAGLTGVSSAAHCISHNFEVVIFEAAPRSGLGGIWSHVNSTSGLQLNSHLYRFHPALIWRHAFPLRDEILSEISRIWKEYQLEPRTRFETPVTSVKRVETEDGSHKWRINDGEEEPFDAVIVTIGTCGKPKWIHLDGMPKDVGGSKDSNNSEETKADNTEETNDKDVFKKPIIHSSELDSDAVSEETIKGKKVVVIGSGASGVEAVETALQRGAGEVVMVARTDKWIIPRNIFFDTFLACQPFGREMPLSFLWESLLKHTHYRGVEDLVPAHAGLFEGTPVVNDAFLGHVKNGRCKYVRGDPVRLTSAGVLTNVRARDTKPGSEGNKKTIDAEVIVLATGFERPKIDFLDDSLFPEDYQRPDLYLQNFSTEDWSVLLTNSSYSSGIGTVGHFHIGIYTRILLTLLLDANARPSPKDMKLWVDVVRFMKRGAAGGPLGFFTYAELTIWVVMFHFLRLDRLRWFFFILFGWGVHVKERGSEEGGIPMVRIQKEKLH